jgi:hypothetical protein
MVGLIQQAVAGISATAQGGDLVGAVDDILAALGADGRWHAVNAEFTAHALRHPDVAAALAWHRRAVRQALTPILETVAEAAAQSVAQSVAQSGSDTASYRGATDLLARTIIAIHDGTMAQVLIEPDAAALRAWQRDLLLRSIFAP